MAATEKMKNGEAFDLLSELAKEPAFGMTLDEMEKLLSPEEYTGRCASQVERYVDSIKDCFEGAEEPGDETEY